MVWKYLRNHRRTILLIAAACCVTFAISAVAQQPTQTRSNLLDRGGDAPQSLVGDTRGPLPTATLANGAGSPGVTIGAIMTFAPPAPVGVFHGYFFAPGVDFPTSYFPFNVTGAYIWAGPPILGSPVIGAGAAPSTGGMVGSFTSMAVPFGPFSPGMIFGAKGLFGTVGIPVASGGVACGFDPGVAGAVLGALTPGTGGGKPIVAFAPGGTVTPIAAPPATYVAGCYITGATVPVELQSFSIE